MDSGLRRNDEQLKPGNELMARKEFSDIVASRLSAATLTENYADIAPPLDRQSALIAAQRCHFCFDAPCIKACPTGIDIPMFIRGVATDNLRGAAMEILDANILGGMCARVCPTERSEEHTSERNHPNEKAPVAISALQRYATDWVYETSAPLFARAADTGKKVAVVGAGPAGLACAHALARAGHHVTVFDAQPKPGGLNEYGIARYKVLDFAAREIAWLLSIGGIEVRNGQKLGANLKLADLRRDYDAVFLGIGLSGVNALGIQSEQLAGVRNAVDFIAELRQADLAKVPVGRRVVVIGGGNTAIDAAVQSKKLGAEAVTLVYRRGAASMSATHVEQEFAKSEGVNVINWAAPKRLLARDGAVSGIEFEHTLLDDQGNLIGSGDLLKIDADVVLKAIGQVLVPASNGADMLQLAKGRIVVNSDYATSLEKVYAGGDCVGGKVDLTVQAVEDGKRAARSIDAALRNG